MQKEEAEPKMNEKNTQEIASIIPKMKISKEKKNILKFSSTPKKMKKRINTPSSKEKDTLGKMNIIKSKVPPSEEKKKNEKNEKTNIIQITNEDQKNNNEEIQNISSNIKENKEKRNWKSWSPEEKILFYEIIANGGNYGSLQKLFKTINDVSIK
jgi:hypothetical protein